MWCGTQIYNPNAYKNEAGGDHEPKAKLGFIMRKKYVIYHTGSDLNWLVVESSKKKI